MCVNFYIDMPLGALSPLAPWFSLRFPVFVIGQSSRLMLDRGCDERNESETPVVHHLRKGRSSSSLKENKV